MCLVKGLPPVPYLPFPNHNPGRLTPQDDCKAASSYFIRLVSFAPFPLLITNPHCNNTIVIPLTLSIQTINHIYWDILYTKHFANVSCVFYYLHTHRSMNHVCRNRPRLVKKLIYDHPVIKWWNQDFNRSILIPSTAPILNLHVLVPNAIFQLAEEMWRTLVLAQIRWAIMRWDRNMESKRKVERRSKLKTTFPYEKKITIELNLWKV